jgi:hypothetical protein
MSAHWEDLDISATSLEKLMTVRLIAAPEECSRRAGKGMDGYVRGCVFVVEEEKIRSAHRETNNTPTPSLCSFHRNPSH